MKKAALLILVLFFASPSFAQISYVGTNQWFPLVTVGGDPNGLHYDTLVQISNNSSSFETAVLTVFSDTGSQMAVSYNGGAPVTSYTVTPALNSGVAQQIQITATGAITNAAWLQITYNPDNNSSGAETTVILQYLSGTTILSEIGINPFFGTMTDTSSGPATVFPVETNLSSNLNTGIAIANPSGAAAVLVQLLSGSTVLGSTTISLAANGHTAKLLTDLFPNVSGISQMTAEVALTSCTTTACTAAGPGLIATALRLNIATGLFTAVPVVPTPSGGASVRLIPHIAIGGAPGGINFQTVLYLTNPTGSSITGGQINLFDNNGNPLAASANGSAAATSFPFSFAAGSVFKIALSGGSTLQSGWAELTVPTGTSLIINALFQTYNGPTVISEASVLESPAQTEGLIYVNLTPGTTNVGVALANPSTTNASTITLTLYNDGGFTDASFQYIVTLPPLGHLARYITDMFPQLAGANFTGTLSIQSGLGFSAVALRQNGTSVVGFAAIPVAYDVMFIPALTNLQINSTNRTVAGGQVIFTVSVIDYSPNLVASTSTLITAGVAVFYPNIKTSSGTGCFDGYFTITLDGTALLNSPNGNLTGTYAPGGSNCISSTTVPSGTSAVFYVILEDSLGNLSNQITLPFKF